MTQEEIKIELVKAIEAQVWEANTGAEEAEQLLSCMHVYEYFLVRTLARKATTKADLADMMRAISDAQQLLIELVNGEQEMMFGWTYGNIPENRAQALAGVLVLIGRELNAEVYEFIRNNPKL